MSTVAEGLADGVANGLGAMRSILLESVAAVPAEARGDWEHYVNDTVLNGMWTRSALSRRDRSLITVAAVAGLRCPMELQAQVRAALANDISSRALCEVVLQVGGYAGFGVAREAMSVLSQVLESRGVGVSSREEAAKDGYPASDHTTDRLSRAKAILDLLMPERADLPPPDPPVFAPDWPSWLRETAFGDLWARPHLTLIEREKVTMAVLMVLNRPEELQAHLRIASSLGIPPVEIGEQIMHLAIYAGFPASVDAMRIATGTLGQTGPKD
jgi:4-carboxymuconolactone decarboxylase